MESQVSLLSLSFSLSLYIYFKFYLSIFVCAGSLLQLSGATLHCSAGASHCGGFSCCRACALERGRLSSCGTQVACGTFPDRRRQNLPKPVSLAVTGGFLTTLSPGKSASYSF